MSESNQPPVRHVRRGAITASIWKNESQNTGGPYYATTFQRRYREGQEGEWKTSYSFGQKDLLLLANVAVLAHAAIHDLLEADKTARKPQGSRVKEARPVTAGNPVQTRVR